MILYIWLLVAVDQLSKYLFYNIWYYQDSIFLFQPILNTGISRSISANIFVIITITIFFLIVIVWSHNVRYIDRLSIVLLLSWTIGNLIDRLMYQWVRDRLRLWLWPVFNIADVFITLWLILYIYKSIIKKN